MSEEEVSASPTPPKKFSRYRSVRQQVEAAKTEPPPVPEQKDGNSSIARSMSRYRRTKAAPRHDQLSSPPMPPNPIPQARAEGSPAGRDTARRVTEPSRSPEKHQIPVRNDTVAHRRPETEEQRKLRRAREMREQQQEHRRIQIEQEEQELRKAEEEVKAAQQAEEEKANALAEQKRKDLERLEAELDAAPPLSRVASPREKFAFFSRKRSGTKVTPPTTAGSGNNSVSRIRTNSNPPRGINEPVTRASNDTPTRKSIERPARAIEQGGGGIVPGIDAPMSAVNAGERRVLIRCKQSSINLPITPETTPVDLVYTAANIMSQNISPSTAVLLESYTQLGLERRIRRYEHIRDVMNSWDRDTQNALILQNSDSPNHDHDLEPTSVPREAPKDVTVYMYHSQKPGKWNKRHITLLLSGQIFMAKKPGAKISDKDIVSLCHLSDFDIYTPTPQQIRKNLKPPKKHCHAIKSQQKTTMFLSTENFVHFFCTDDEVLMEKWYVAVQRWRSWYLVNRMGEGKKAKGKAVAELTTTTPARPGTRGGPTHKVKVSVDEDPYTIGSFKPLMDPDRFGTQSDPEYDSEEENRPRQIPFHLRNSVSLTPLPSRKDTKRHPPPVSYRLPPDAEEEFASSGLLGRSYSQRQHAYKEREAALQQSTSAFVEGPSLLNGPGHQRTLSTRRPQTAGGPGLQRSTSKWEKPQPLLDFTPQFKEAPQWDKTGKGHGVPAPSGVPLIEVATNPETRMDDIPKSTVFRREAAARPATSAGPGTERAFVKGGLILGTGNGGNRERANS